MPKMVLKFVVKQCCHTVKNSTKIGEKCQNLKISNATFLEIFKQVFRREEPIETKSEIFKHCVSRGSFQVCGHDKPNEAPTTFMIAFMFSSWMLYWLLNVWWHVNLKRGTFLHEDFFLKSKYSFTAEKLEMAFMSRKWACVGWHGSHFIAFLLGVKRDFEVNPVAVHSIRKIAYFSVLHQKNFFFAFAPGLLSHFLSSCWGSC